MKKIDAIEWTDYLFRSDNRTVLTENEMGIPGLKTFGYHCNAKAIAGLENHYHRNCIEIVSIVKGNITFFVQDKEFNLHGGEVFITKENEIHSTGKNPTSVCEYYWMQINTSNPNLFLGLSEEWSKSLINNLRNIKNRVVKPLLSFQKILKKAFDLCLENDKYYAVISIINFLYDLINNDKQNSPVLLHSEIDIVANYIIENINNEFDLVELASICHLSLSRFKQKFKDQIGVTPRVFINSNKIEASKKLLLQNKSVTEVAFQLGFSSSNYFAVVFKRFTSLTPTEFISQKNQENKKNRNP